MTVRKALCAEAFEDFADNLIKSDEYALSKDGALKETALELHKNKIERDIKSYLYAVMQNMQSQSQSVSTGDSHAGHSH